jgi:hypothetical protein
MPRKAMLGGLIVLVVLIGIQLVPVDRSDPPAPADLTQPPAVAAILRRACFDCHSNHTRWPWYSHVAPVSWLVAADVREARGKMNFSRWGEMPAAKQGVLAGYIWHQVDTNGMPLPRYRMIHHDARLSDADRAVLRAWAGSYGPLTP